MGAAAIHWELLNTFVKVMPGVDGKRLLGVAMASVYNDARGRWAREVGERRVGQVLNSARDAETGQTRRRGKVEACPNIWEAIGRSPPRSGKC